MNLYILLHDVGGAEKSRSAGSYDTSRNCTLPRGSLCEGIPDPKSPKHKIIRLLSCKESVVVLADFVKNGVSPIDFETYELLVAISGNEDRYKVFQDKIWQKEIKEFQLGSVVYVKLETEKVVGKVRYRGKPIDQIRGIWFGVELSKVWFFLLKIYLK